MARPKSDPETSLARAIRRTLLGAVILVCLAVFVLWRADNPRLERLRMSIVDAAAPPMAAVTGPLETAGDAIRDIETFFDVYEQNRELRREIQRLKAWRETARTLEEENAQLRALNNVRLAPRTTFVTGDVIADSGGPFREQAIVNVGAADGVLDGSAAVDGTGLVGRVAGLGEHASRLLLVTDFSSRLPVVIQPGGARAIMTGDGTLAPRLDFLDPAAEPRPGALVATSGDGAVFPPDLPVGRVILVGDDFRVALNSDLGRLEFVRLLRFQPNTAITRPGGLVLPGGEDEAAPEPMSEPAPPLLPGDAGAETDPGVAGR